MQGWEIPVGVLLEPIPFTAANRLLTPTLKKCRPQLEQKYKPELEKLYKDQSEDGVRKRCVQEILSIIGGSRPKCFLILCRTLEERILSCFQDCLVKMPAASEILPHDPTPTESLAPTDISPLDLSLTLPQLGGDSVSASLLSYLLKQRFQVDIPVPAILSCPLMEILSVLNPPSVFPQSNDTARDEHSGQLSPQPVRDWNDEIEIPSSGVPAEKSDLALKDHVAFLTGVKGFLGRFILWELLHQPDCTRIYCLVLTQPPGEFENPCYAS